MLSELGGNMNERIKELADQALKECDAAKERVIDQYSKRFAELVVREWLILPSTMLVIYQLILMLNLLMNRLKNISELTIERCNWQRPSSGRSDCVDPAERIYM
jgi:hypothetical protein